jgi:hypothetical protein
MGRRRPPAFIREAVAVLDAHGHAADIDIAGSGHFKITWTTRGQKRVFVLGRTPSDRRADNNARAILRRLLREEERSQ